MSCTLPAVLTRPSFSKPSVPLRVLVNGQPKYIAMRALGDPDAFPHADLILRRAPPPPTRARPSPPANC